MESFEERYGTKSEVTRYRVDRHGVHKLSSQSDTGLLIGVNRFIKVSDDHLYHAGDSKYSHLFFLYCSYG